MPALAVEKNSSSSDYWLDYFRQNAVEPDLPWTHHEALSGAERHAVLASIQQFQLGEGASGTRMLRFAQRFCERSGDSGLIAALRLFLCEEQRHSQLLARFLALEHVACLRKHWIHGAFRWLRGLAGLELCLKVLVTAEILARPYYAALRDATRSPLLRCICERILDEESAHLRFQAFVIGRFQAHRHARVEPLIRALHQLFLRGTAAVVWLEHKSVFESAGRTFNQFWSEARFEFDLLYRTR